MGWSRESSHFLGTREQIEMRQKISDLIIDNKISTNEVRSILGVSKRRALQLVYNTPETYFLSVELMTYLMRLTEVVLSRSESQELP